MKVVPIITDITMDTTAHMESYSNYWTKRIEELKVDLKKQYQDRYLSEKKTYDERVAKNEEWGKKLGRKGQDLYNAALPYKYMTEYKNKLDSAEKGLFNYSVLNVFQNLSVEKSQLHQLTVKYKLNDSGPTMIQKFIIEELQTDTTSYPTDESMIDFIRKSGLRRNE